MTNCHIKYVLFKNVGDIFRPKEDETGIKRIFEQMNDLYIDACLNPFLNGKLQDKSNKLVQRFRDRIKSKCLIGQYILYSCLLYTSDAADDTPCVDLGGRRIIKKKKIQQCRRQIRIQKLITYARRAIIQE
eukprot:TRINITY_DN10238_c0_g1_i2.p2 TRINITY_DN10238_c0_g1~~TRINITY_DN10238_c0_g1_i2.p2  ORF type:complete len:131 (-),score=13.08 TRINITY_DN10238_c0_g1_i2:13-405(-)